MKIFECLADRIIKRAQRTPYFDLEGYMQRWWLHKPRGYKSSHASDHAESGVGARVHRIIRSDTERHMHDHPWMSISIILRGGYWEIMPAMNGQDMTLDPWLIRKVWRGPGSIVFRRASDRHRLEIAEGGEAWTLFIMGPWRKVWGFYTDAGFVPWREYLGIELEPANDNEAREAFDRESA